MTDILSRPADDTLMTNLTGHFVASNDGGCSMFRITNKDPLFKL